MRQDALLPHPVTLLSRHNQTHLGFRVLDQITAHIHGDAVDLAGELERRRVLGRDWKTGIGATGQATRVEGDWRRIRDIGVSDQSAIDVELASPRHTMAMWNIRLAGRLELEA